MVIRKITTFIVIFVALELYSLKLVEIAFKLLHPLEQELTKKQFLIATLYDSLRLAK